MILNSAEFFKPENFLQKKAGVGGLSQAMIESAQSNADAIEFSFEPYASNKIAVMKSQLDSEGFLQTNNDKSLETFLHDLVPFDISAKIAKNSAISTISDNLLKFIEALPKVNIDSHHVIRAHINAMDILTKKKINDISNPSIKNLINELKESCNRYHAKHANYKDDAGEWSVS